MAATYIKFDPLNPVLNRQLEPFHGVLWPKETASVPDHHRSLPALFLKLLDQVLSFLLLLLTFTFL